MEVYRASDYSKRAWSQENRFKDFIRVTGNKLQRHAVEGIEEEEKPLEMPIMF